jgi:hypothetical protein
VTAVPGDVSPTPQKKVLFIVQDEQENFQRPLLYAFKALGPAPFACVKKTLPGGRISKQLEHSSASFIYSAFLTILVFFSSQCAIIFNATNWNSETGTSEVKTTSLASLFLNLTKSRNGIVRIMFLTVKIDEVLLQNPANIMRKQKLI